MTVDLNSQARNNAKVWVTHAQVLSVPVIFAANVFADLLAGSKVPNAVGATEA